MADLEQTQAQDTIQLIWSKDPRELTDEEVFAIVNKLREARTKWQTEEVSARNQGRKVRPSQGISAEALSNLTLDELQLGPGLDLSGLGLKKGKS